MSVLVVCNDPIRDPGIALVEAALARRNVSLEFLRADLFPVDTTLTVLLNGESRPSRWLHGVQSIWLRHADPGASLPPDLRADVAVAITEQAMNALSTLLAEADVPVFDHPDTLALAPIKPRQLAIARRVGLRTPRTMLSNDAGALRAFAAECQAGLVTKMIESVPVHAVVDGAEVGGLTRAVTDEDLRDEASLAMCPMIFQERIRKVRDWRVTVVADRVFPAVVRAGDVLDWRSDRGLIAGFEAASLPAEVEQKLLDYCSRVGVQFAAFDLVEDREGALWFIEANTTAYFHFVEQATGQPISSAIAALLVGELEPRP
jgi:glutathione synthase/RimK-type ligase-like ATP-grasp enzyme